MIRKRWRESFKCWKHIKFITPHEMAPRSDQNHISLMISNQLIKLTLTCISGPLFMEKYFSNNEPCRSMISPFCDLLRNIVDHNITDRNIANSLCVAIICYNSFSVKCDLRDAPSHVGSLRHFNLSDIWGMWCDEGLLMRDFALQFRNLKIPLVRRHPLPFCDAMLFIKQMVLIERIIKLNSFWDFRVFS